MASRSDQLWEKFKKISNWNVFLEKFEDFWKFKVRNEENYENFEEFW